MSIDKIKGIGPKSMKLLNKLEIYTISDLQEYYPYRYNIYHFSSSLLEDTLLCMQVIIESSPNVSYIKRNFNRLSFRANANSKLITVTIFNRAFLKNNLLIGKKIIIIGKYDKKKNTFVASDIKFDIVDGQIEPVYHLTKGLSNKAINKFIISSLDNKTTLDKIPSSYILKYNFIRKDEALRLIHEPKSEDDIMLAKSRLIYEELFEFAFKMNYLKIINKRVIGIAKMFDESKVEDFINSLSFTLTDDQQKSVKEILKDLKSKSKMNRLLLGDVGSGKTIVSVIAMYACFLSGFQTALMAPTEILAIQHFNSIRAVLNKFNVNVGLITGSLTKMEKKKTYEKVKNNEINILIGTHSLLNEELEFNNIGLVVTDEQHRFGVNQRGIFQSKGNNLDILYLSATPIPRTYAMTIYGDLDISIIKTKPRGRKDIITKLYKSSDIKEILYAILQEIKLGHQVYIISPLVEDNDNQSLSSVMSLKENIDRAFNNLIKSEVIYGKLKQKEKDLIMDSFLNNDTKILISTTVIEVGIDVPNASMIVIYNAERFGLATLHQLRGRVGRSNIQSYCHLISDYDSERLRVMEESNDGFYIAEKDFKLRGHGDLFGTRQHGDMTFKLADLKNNYDILVNAKNDSDEFILNKDYLNNKYYNNIVNSLDITN